MKSIAVIGLGQFGYQLAIALSQKGFDVIAVDNEVAVINEIKEIIDRAVIVDTTDEIAMRAINITNVDIAIVSMGTNVQASLLTTALLQRLNIDNIYVRAIDSLQEQILHSMGIENVINIEKDMGKQLANTLSTDVGRYIEISDRHSLMEIKVPPRLVSKSLIDLDLRNTYRVNIVGIRTATPKVTDEGEIEYTLRMTDIPDPAYIFKEQDMLIISGTDDRLNRFIQMTHEGEH